MEQGTIKNKGKYSEKLEGHKLQRSVSVNKFKMQEFSEN